jgi:hypothetical protein
MSFTTSIDLYGRLDAVSTLLSKLATFRGFDVGIGARTLGRGFFAVFSSCAEKVWARSGIEYVVGLEVFVVAH